MIRKLVQLTLDNALFADGVYSFWQRKSEIADHDEYIVYTTTDIDEYADAYNEPLIKAAEVTVKYFYRAEMAEVETGRQTIDSRKKAIMQSMKNAGFDCPFGAFDGGDIDGNGYLTAIFEFEYRGAVYG